jgi:hypothetical protein
MVACRLYISDVLVEGFSLFLPANVPEMMHVIYEVKSIKKYDFYNSGSNKAISGFMLLLQMVFHVANTH